MALIDFKAFVGSSYRAESVNADCETLVNFYAAPIESPTGKSPGAVVFDPTPGTINFATRLDSPSRAVFYQDGRAFGVGGGSFYEFAGNGSATFIGSVARDSNPAWISSNGHAGHQLLVVSGGLGYIFDLNTNTLTRITDTAFPANALFAEFLGGYFIVAQASTSNFFLSALNNGLDWSTNILEGQTSNTSDNLVAIKIVGTYLWLMGSKHTEVWVNTGPSAAGSFPFAPIQGGVADDGCGAPWTLINVAGTACAVGISERGGAFVVQSNDYNLKKISTYAVDRSLSERLAAGTLPSARAWSYEEHGHTFFVINLMDGTPAWVYDTTTGEWHQRGDFDTGSGTFVSPRAVNHAFGFGRHLCGDGWTGDVLDQSLAYTTNADGTSIVRERTAPHLNNAYQWTFYDEFRLMGEFGLGANADPDTDPQCTLSYSDDFWHTFTPPQARSMGQQGQYAFEVYWQMLGRARDKVFRWRTNSTRPVRLQGAVLRARPGREIGAVA